MTTKTIEEWAALRKRLIDVSKPLPPWFIESMLIDAIDVITEAKSYGLEPTPLDMLDDKKTAAIMYPWQFMKVNDSFFVETAGNRPDRLFRRLRKLAAAQFKKKRNPIAVTVHSGKKLINGEMIDGFYLVRRG